MRGLAITLVLAAGVLAGSARADDVKPAAPPAGPWVREAEGVELSLRFGPAKDRLLIAIMAGDNGVELKTKIDHLKDGVTQAEVLAADEKGSFPGAPPKGMKFRFKFQPAADGKTATVSDYAGDMSDEGKKFFEGEYKLSEKKEK